MSLIGYVHTNRVVGFNIESLESRITICDITGEYTSCLRVTLTDDDEDSWSVYVSQVHLPKLADAICGW